MIHLKFAARMRKNKIAADKRLTVQRLTTNLIESIFNFLEELCAS